MALLFLESICIFLWLISLLLVGLHDVDNGGRLFLCWIGRNGNGTVYIGFQKSNFHVLGLANLCILATNMSTYIAIFVKIWKEKSTVLNWQKSTLRKMISFAVVYALLHGPFNLITIVTGVFKYPTRDPPVCD